MVRMVLVCTVPRWTLRWRAVPVLWLVTVNMMVLLAGVYAYYRAATGRAILVAMAD